MCGRAFCEARERHQEWDWLGLGLEKAHLLRRGGHTGTEVGEVWSGCRLKALEDWLAT